MSKGKCHHKGMIRIAMNYRIYVILCFFGMGLNVVPLNAQSVVRNVRIHGNSDVDSHELCRFMNIQEGHALPDGWPGESLEALLGGYHRQGFLLARVDSLRESMPDGSHSVDIQLWLFEGPPVKVGRFEIRKPETVHLGKIERLVHTHSGMTFDAAILEQDIDAILEFLENTGHPLAHVGIHAFRLNRSVDPPEVEIDLNVRPGSEVRIDRIRADGNRVTKEDVIVRETRLSAGDLYDHKKVTAVQEKLQRLSYFREVKAPEVSFVQNRAILTLRVTEGNATTVDGVLGYHPSNEQEKSGYFTGRLECMFRNLMGTGRFLEAYWEKKDAYSIEFKLKLPAGDKDTIRYEVRLEGR